MLPVIGFVAGLDSRRRALPLQVTAMVHFCALVVEALHACGLDRPSAAGLSARVWSLELGTCLAGRYILRRSLGPGGRGDVFEAFDTEGDCAVAIKTPRARDCDNPDATRRLLTEAVLAGRVSHPNVVRVRDVGVHRDAHSPPGVTWHEDDVGRSPTRSRY